MEPWLISLLSINSVEEFSFSYNKEQKIFIDGKRIGGEWVISIYVSAFPNFLWGCNGYNTKIHGSHKEVIRYYISLVINQLADYGIDYRPLVDVLRSDF